MSDPDRKTPDFSLIKAVYFDLDDTLCAYWDASKVGLKGAFEAHPIANIPASEMVRHWAAAFREYSPTLKDKGWYDRYLKSGAPTRLEQMRLTLLRAGVDDLSHAERLSDEYMRLRDQALALFPDAWMVLEQLSPKYPLGLITNGPADIQRQEIATLNIGEFFQNVFIEGEMGEGKPHLTVFRRAEKAVGLQPHEILFVGNSYDHDIAPAINAGWRTAWVRRPSDVPPSADPALPAKPKEIQTGQPLPDLIVGELSALLPLLLPG
ncbi:MAG: hypothetical protein BGO01_07195 [Armatimonadetes bacterium 55-13]|nr:HAD family hydrolase [Armatimonadota bacterium]ODU53877.1 MAG: hypothetical protein ABT09_00860 [bacterium SCN 57-13]OJU62285.1 MAG: hypothetical protein BGO01_07195 [Armatimonadetes bacterium 55-13]